MTPVPPRLSQRLSILLASGAALLLQVTWTRLFSVSHWYHLAFLVVGTALLGHGLGGTASALNGRIGRLSVAARLGAAGVLMAALASAGFLLVNELPFAPFKLTAEGRQVVFLGITFLSLAAPFACVGFATALLVKEHPRHAGTIYAADLIGAGMGVVAFVLIVPRLGGAGAVSCSAALAAAAGACALQGRLRWGAIALCLAFSLGALVADAGVPIHIDPAKVFLDHPVDELISSPARLFSGWTSSSRIDVLQAPWGPQILIDAGTAMTRIPVVDRPVETLGPVPDERALALRTRHVEKVLVIGSGGGADVLAALQQGATHVVAVEVNPLINELVTGRFSATVGHIFEDPRVELHTDEARSFVRRSADRFDAILATHTISNAATSSGALSMTEDYVLTVDAFEDYLGHLEPDGALFFTRPESQLPRLVATMREALHRRGIDDATNRIIVFATGPEPSFYGGAVLRLESYLPDEAPTALGYLRQADLRTLYLPPTLGGKPDEADLYSALVTAPYPELAGLYRALAVRIDPVDDNRPFFNQRAKFNELFVKLSRSIFDQPLTRVRLAIETLPVAETVLVLVLGESMVLAAVLAIVAGRRARRARRMTHDLRALGYFFLLGIGYILVELTLLQRFTLVVGRPEHAFVIVVATMLIASGAGSGQLAPLVSRQQSRRAIGLVFGLIALIVTGAAVPSFHAILSHSLAVRAATSVGFVTIVALPLGVAFPLGIEKFCVATPQLVPWAWGMNAVASVIGSALAVLLAIQIGFSGVLIVAALAYLAAGALLLRPSLDPSS
jgi:hypothetical protein